MKFNEKWFYRLEYADNTIVPMKSIYAENTYIIYSKDSGNELVTIMIYSINGKEFYTIDMSKYINTKVHISRGRLNEIYGILLRMIKDTKNIDSTYDKAKKLIKNSYKYQSKYTFSIDEERYIYYNSYTDIREYEKIKDSIFYTHVYNIKKPDFLPTKDGWLPEDRHTIILFDDENVITNKRVLDFLISVCVL